MKWYDGLRHPGVLAALSAAILFGAGTPLAKQLLNTVSPWLLAGLLYLGSGIGLTLYRLITRPAAVSLPRNELLWFIGAILSGDHRTRAANGRPHGYARLWRITVTQC